MAESFVFNIADKLLGKATSLVLDQVCLAGGVYSELEKLKDTISTLRAVLLDAEEQQSNNHQLTDWLRKLKDCFYDAEDVLDEFGYDSLLREAVNEEGGGIRRKVRHFFTTSNPLAFRFKMGSKIKEIRERLDRIASDAHNFNLKNIILGSPVPVLAPGLRREREMTYSFVCSSDVIGRDDDKKNIIQLLLMQSSYDDSEKNVSVLPLVGIGGLGKTTLAKLVYNDAKVVAHFKKRMWVCVSDEFDVTRLLKEIITSLTDKKCDDLPIDVLQRHLRNELDDDKFFLVLDDVWNTNRDKWLQLKALVDVGAEGSQIIVTTRDKLVADGMGTHPMYEVKGLSNEECLSVFIRCAFKDGEDKRYPRLVGIGKDIVKKCKGLPLAVRTLGGLLYSKTDESDWVRVRDSEIWQLEQKKDDILPALKLSYNSLPFNLKHCVAFCSLFPKDYRFNETLLIGMWMGQGLIQPSELKEDMEDIGKQYIDALLQISFFLDVEDYDIGFFRIFKMHDLVHDLASLVARPECSILKFDSKNICAKIRHVSMFEGNWPEEEEKVSRFFGKLDNNIRTISFPCIKVGPRSDSFVTSCILRFKYIRVLDLRESSFKKLPHSICNLKLLKYLDLSCNKNIKRLPNSICKLHHLQTLSLADCESLEELPRHTGKMMSLRYLKVTTQQMALAPHKEREVVGRRRCFFNSLRFLFIGGCDRLESLVEEMGNFSFSFTALRTLIIMNCPRLLSLPRNLPALENLMIMNCESLEFDSGNREREDGEDDSVRGCGFGSLRALIFLNLPKLEILPRWLLTSTLLHLIIGECINFRALMSEEEEESLIINLTSLETLVIDDCPHFSLLPEAMDHLTSLRQLYTVNCPQLSALPEKMTHLSALIHLTIQGCHTLTKRCKRETGEDWYKIAHVQHLYLSSPSDSDEESDVDEAAAGTSQEG